MDEQKAMTCGELLAAAAIVVGGLGLVVCMSLFGFVCGCATERPPVIRGRSPISGLLVIDPNFTCRCWESPALAVDVDTGERCASGGQPCLALGVLPDGPYRLVNSEAMQGPNIPYVTRGFQADRDGDGDVDLADEALWQRELR